MARDSICWDCIHSHPNPALKTGCEWAIARKPIQGWQADPVNLPQNTKNWRKSYRVRSCPKFVMEDECRSIFTPKSYYIARRWAAMAERAEKIEQEKIAYQNAKQGVCLICGKRCNPQKIVCGTNPCQYKFDDYRKRISSYPKAKVCNYCGKKFDAYHASQKFCSELCMQWDNYYANKKRKDKFNARSKSN